MDPELSGVDYLARTAYRKLRAWYPRVEGRGMPHWDLLTPLEKRAFREMIITVWNEVWTNSRPPVLPTAEPREPVTGKASCFSLLHGSSSDPDKR